MEPTTSRLDRLTTDTKDLATHVAALERHVTTVVDPIAATHARTTLRELEALTELTDRSRAGGAPLTDPDLTVSARDTLGPGRGCRTVRARWPGCEPIPPRTSEPARPPSTATSMAVVSLSVYGAHLASTD